MGLELAEGWQGTGRTWVAGQAKEGWKLEVHEKEGLCQAGGVGSGGSAISISPTSLLPARSGDHFPWTGASDNLVLE